MATMTETNTARYTVLNVGGLGMNARPKVTSEFEVHAAGCAHVARRRQYGANDWTVTAGSAEEVVAGEVADFQAQDQGWDFEHFRIFPCVKDATPTPVPEPEPESGEVTPEVAQVELDRRKHNRKAKRTGEPRQEPADTDAAQAAFEMRKADLQAVIDAS